MYRQSPSRAQRSKGIKIKHVLQICLLLAVCFWLIYQVKHSHDKKKEFDESNAKTSLSTGSRNEILTLGRKDIRPRVEETVTKNDKRDEAAVEQESTEEEEVEDKHEEDEQEIKKAERKEGEGTGDGDDEINEQEHDKSDAEVVQEEEFIDEEKEGDEGGENGTEEKDSESNGETEKEGSLEDSDHDGDERRTHEAREEHYKADDASSAVAHDNQLVDPENENGSLENTKKQPRTNILEQESRENNGKEINLGEKKTDLEVEGGEITESDNQLNVTTNEGKGNLTGKSENSSLANTSLTEGSDDHLETKNNSPEMRMESRDRSLQNGTESKLELNISQNEPIGDASEGGNSSTLDVDNNHVDSNSTTPVKTEDSESSPGKFSDSSNNSESSIESGNDTESLTVQNDATETKKSDSDGTTDEFSDKTSVEFQHDPIDLSDSSNSMYEKDVRTDLGTLPEIQTAGTSIEDAAVE